MKTKNNVKEATRKLLASGLILVAVSISLNAQNSEKLLTEAAFYNGKALAMIDNTIETYSAPTGADVSASYLITETEEALELEDWMTDETSFDVYPMSVQPEPEEALNLEDWMIDETYFNPFAFQVMAETESELELENWMTSDEVWNL
jgi:hypothetical protein